MQKGSETHIVCVPACGKCGAIISNPVKVVTRIIHAKKHYGTAIASLEPAFCEACGAKFRYADAFPTGISTIYIHEWEKSDDLMKED